jgi:predicted nucleotide-binding protein
MVQKEFSKPQLPLTPDGKRAAIARLESRIKELENLDVSKVQTRKDGQLVRDLERRVNSTIADIYGKDVPHYLMNIELLEVYTSAPMDDVRAGIDRNRERAISILRGEIDTIEEELQFPLRSHPFPSEPVANASDAITHSREKIAKAEPSDEIFVVHGRDQAAKETVARVIERAGLKPVILHEQANSGKTIIEKFEKHGSAAGFAVIIATPDDVGGLAEPTPKLEPRARQNVIGEMFWFAGRLGREKVCALVKGNIEMPTDFAGVVYTALDNHGAWKAKLLQELAAAGYKDLNWQAALN